MNTRLATLATCFSLLTLATPVAQAQLLVDHIEMDGYLLRLTDGAMLELTGSVASVDWPESGDGLHEVKGNPTDLEPGLLNAAALYGLQEIVLTGDAVLPALLFEAGHAQFDAPGYRWHDRTDAADLARLKELKCVLGGKGDQGQALIAASVCDNLLAAPSAHILLDTVRTKHGYRVTISGKEGGLAVSTLVKVGFEELHETPGAFIDAVLDAVELADWSN